MPGHPPPQALQKAGKDERNIAVDFLAYFVSSRYKFSRENLVRD